MSTPNKSLCVDKFDVDAKVGTFFYLQENATFWLNQSKSSILSRFRDRYSTPETHLWSDRKLYIFTLNKNAYVDKLDVNVCVKTTTLDEILIKNA